MYMLLHVYISICTVHIYPYISLSLSLSLSLYPSLSLYICIYIYIYIHTSCMCSSLLLFVLACYRCLLFQCCVHTGVTFKMRFRALGRRLGPWQLQASTLAHMYLREYEQIPFVTSPSTSYLQFPPTCPGTPQPPRGQPRRRRGCKRTWTPRRGSDDEDQGLERFSKPWHVITTITIYHCNRKNIPI